MVCTPLQGSCTGPTLLLLSRAQGWSRGIRAGGWHGLQHQSELRCLLMRSSASAPMPPLPSLGLSLFYASQSAVAPGAAPYLTWSCGVCWAVCWGGPPGNQPETQA